ncbi:MAG: glycoside hydrolase family 3 C-terminal domain-containing protein [Lachnospiraceae bacterium]|nr:glycoside hydrolase family 3 C-terminal domain-containing protein [Lachnospiraceae bacterium]
MKIREEQRRRAEALLERLTLEEKICMIHGAGLFETGSVERLGIPPLKMSDGPMGVRREFRKDSWEPAGNTDDYVTYLPSNSAIASTWNRELAYESGKVLGAEARGRGKDVILAPGINIKRSPLCGRNFEYMSEDPYLTAEQCVPLIQGIQENDVAACVKHFALNNQERNRLWVDTKVEERALREIYLPAFRAAAERGEALSMMGAYNLVRGSRCCENEYLLDEILRKEWGWDGVVISDWGGILRTKESACVSMDVEMSIYSNFDEYFFAKPLLEAVQNGEIAEETVDEKVYRILCMMMALHMLDGAEQMNGNENGSGTAEERTDWHTMRDDRSSGRKRKCGCYNAPAHRQAALETARESVVLLKNEDSRLPLQKEKLKKLLVVGCNADCLHSLGGGSAEIKALYEISPLMGLKCLLGGNTEVTYVPGYYIPDNREQAENWQEESLKEREGKTAAEELVTPETAAKRKALLEEAVSLAAEYEDVIFIGGLNHQFDLEDQDRRDMKLPYGQDELIEALLDANPDTILVMNAGSPVEMHRFADRAKAIVWHWYAGMEGGTALAEVLLGEVNPSGKLPESFPVTHMDCSAHSIGTFGDRELADYREGIFVGYRHYETADVPVSFCFGHGLSYTSFSYGDCRAVCCGDGENAAVTISCRVKNVGERAGKETVQLYVHKPQSCVERPAKELKGYEKVNLAPGEEAEVLFCLTKEDLMYYDEQERRMCLEEGRYDVFVGASVKDIRGQVSVVF